MTTLGHVLWIGGASAGKTTVATGLARRHGLRWYSSDAHTWEHRDAAIAAGNEAAARWETMTQEQRAAASPEELVKLNLDFERGPMVVDDLRRLPIEPLIVADGSTALPELVAQGHAERDRAVWLLPTYETHRAFHERKGFRAPRRVPLARRPGDRAAGRGARRQRPPNRRDGRGRGSAGRARGAVRRRARRGATRRDVARPSGAAPVRKRGCRRAGPDYLARPWSTGDEATYTRELLCEVRGPGVLGHARAASGRVRTGPHRTRLTAGEWTSGRPSDISAARVNRDAAV